MNRLLMSLGLPWCLLMIACQTPAQEVPLPMDTQLIRGKLENGFSYYIRKMESENTRGKIGIGLVGRMGYWLEEPSQYGLAHLIEHVIQFSKYSYIEKTGENIRNIYAETYSHKISYINDLFRRELLDTYLEYLPIIAWDSLILENLSDTAKVNVWGRKTVLNELQKRWRSVPEQELEYLMLGGNEQSPVAPDRLAQEIHNIKTFDIRDLSQFYKDWYRPDMQGLIIIGDIPDIKELEFRIRELFSDLKMPQNPKQKSFKNYLKELEVNLPGMTRVLWVRDPYKDKKEAWLHFLKPSPIPKRLATTEDQYKERLLHGIYLNLTQQRLGRLTATHQYNALLNEEPRFYFRQPSDAAVTHYDVSIPFEEDGTFSKTKLEVIYTELERIARYGPTETELTLLKEAVLRGKENQILGNMGGRLYMSAIEDHFIYGSPVLAPEDEIRLLKRQLSDIDAGDIREYACSIMKLPDQVLGVYLPEGESLKGLPTDKELKNWLEDVCKRDIPPLEESDFKAPEALLIQQEIQELPADISYRKTKMEVKDATRLQLKNGMTVILKPMPGEKKVALQGLSTLTASDFKQRRDYVDALKSAVLVQYTGAGEFDKFALERYTNQNKLNLSFSVGTNVTSVSGSVPAGKEEQLLQLFYLYFSKPSTSKEAFEDWLEQEQDKALHKDRSDSVQVSFARKAINLIEGEQQKSAKELSVSNNELFQIDPDRSYKYFQQLYNPESLTLALTGNFKMDTIIPLLLRYLGNLPGKSPEELKLKAVEVNSREMTEHFQLKKGVDTTWYDKGDKFGIYMGWTGEIAQAEDILKLEILEGVIERDVQDRINRLGFYDLPGATFTLYPKDRFAFYTTYSETGGAASVQALEDMIKKVVTHRRKTLMDSEKFENERKALKEKYQNGYDLESHSPLGLGAYLLEVEMKTPGPRTQARQRLKMLKNINPEAVREAAVKYLSEEKINIIRSLPEKERTD